MSGSVTHSGTSDPPNGSAEDDLEEYRSDLERLAQSDLRTAKYAEAILKQIDEWYTHFISKSKPKDIYRKIYPSESEH